MKKINQFDVNVWLVFQTRVQLVQENMGFDLVETRFRSIGGIDASVHAFRKMIKVDNCGLCDNVVRGQSRRLAPTKQPHRVALGYALCCKV
jgi:hypothetical protein